MYNHRPVGWAELRINVFYSRHLSIFLNCPKALSPCRQKSLILASSIYFSTILGLSRSLVPISWARNRKSQHIRTSSPGREGRSGVRNLHHICDVFERSGAIAEVTNSNSLIHGNVTVQLSATVFSALVLFWNLESIVYRSSSLVFTALSAPHTSEPLITPNAQRVPNSGLFYLNDKNQHTKWINSSWWVGNTNFSNRTSTLCLLIKL